MKKYSLILGIALVCAFPVFAELEKVRADNYIYTPLPKDIKPEGWIKEFLQRQESGLTGHPKESGYPFDGGMWTQKLDRKNREFAGAAGWFAYEQTAYYLDGALRVGYLNRSNELLSFVRKNLYHIIDQTKPGCRMEIDGVPDSDWPFVIFNRILLEEYENSKDEKILNALEAHYQEIYNNIDMEKLSMKGFKVRAFLHVENLCLLYQLTGKKEYLDNAIKLYSYFDEKNGHHSTSCTRMLLERRLNGHAVSQHNFMGLPAVLYFYTKNPYYLKAITSGYNSLEKYSELQDGLSSAYEMLGGKRSDEVHETCNVIDFVWSCGWLSMATEDTHWADKIEKVFFNAGLGSIKKDFKAHQYYSSPNQVITTSTNCLWNKKLRMAKQTVSRLCYRAGHDTECCTGNIHRMLPSYIKWMWFVDPKERTITASLYGPETVKFSLSKSETVTVSEKTNYPFENRVDFVFSMNNPSEFAFKMRIPGWSSGYRIFLNGKKVEEGRDTGVYAKLERKYKSGDRIRLELDAEPIISRYKKGMSLSYGALVFSLPVSAGVEINTDLGNGKASVAFPAYEHRPTSSWAYALSKTLKSSDIQVLRSKKTGYPWDSGNSPVALQVKAREALNWKIEEGATPTYPDKPELGKDKTLTLVPLGSTILRITEFPRGDF